MSNDSITAIVVQAVADLLRPLGYCRSGATFARPVEDVVHLVGLQKSQTSTARQVKMTVNLAVWLTALAPIRAGVQDRPNVHSAHVRERLGFVMPEHTDMWWVASTDAEARMVANVMVEALQRYGLPFFGAFHTAALVVKAWREGRSPGLTETQRRRLLQQYEQHTG